MKLSKLGEMVKIIKIGNSGSKSWTFSLLHTNEPQDTENIKSWGTFVNRNNAFKENLKSTGKGQ